MKQIWLLHLLVLSDPHLPKEQDASCGGMQSVTVHLVTWSPAPQEGSTRPDEARVSNRILLEIIVDRANLIVRLVKITQARLIFDVVDAIFNFRLLAV